MRGKSKLSDEQQRIIRTLLSEQPAMSLRAIARAANTSATTVSAYRKSLEVPKMKQKKRSTIPKKKLTQDEAEISTRYSRNELFELYTYFADDDDALEKLSGFMGVDKNNAAAVKLLAEFSAVLDAEQLGMEQRGREREGRYHV